MYFSGNDKISITTCLAYEKKFLPGAKYKINHQLTEKRTPFMANMAKTKGREDQSFDIKPKKDKRPGPGTYNPSKGEVKLSTNERKLEFNFSGLGKIEGAKANIKHADKVKLIKPSRFFDDIVKSNKKWNAPGVGHYKGFE